MENALGTLLDPLILSQIRQIELRTRRAIDADLVGNYRSAFRGSGLSFSDLRQYQPGDEIKNIHWKATARTGTTYVKNYEEDRQLSIMLAIDISRSTAFGQSKSKHEQALKFAAVVTLLAHINQDAIGLALFDRDVQHFMPPKTGRTQVQRMLLEISARRELYPATDIAAALRYMLMHQRRGTVIFLVSDFYAPPFSQELKLAALRHDVVCVLLDDPLDRSLPNVGLVEIEDAESGERLVLDSSNAALRAELERRHSRRREELEQVAHGAGADLVAISDDPIRPLFDLMRRRMRRLH